MALKTRQTPKRQRMQSEAVSSDISRWSQCKIWPSGQPTARFTELVLAICSPGGSPKLNCFLPSSPIALPSLYCRKQLLP